MPGHKCSGQMYALEISPGEEEGELETDDFEQVESELSSGNHELLMSECYPFNEVRPQISLNALSGIPIILRE